jgi:hypothetical protein
MLCGHPSCRIGGKYGQGDDLGARSDLRSWECERNGATRESAEQGFFECLRTQLKIRCQA